MAIYTKKKGAYERLTADQIRRMRSVDQRVALQNAAMAGRASILALTAWLDAVGRQGNKMGSHDLIVTRLPNLQLLRKTARNIEAAVEDLRNS